MSAVDSCFARPWVVQLLSNYEAAVDGKQKAVPAQVAEKYCEFYLRIQRFVILSMETDNVDLLNCNRHPEVKKKIRTLWQDHMEELCMKDTGCSDGPLNRFLKVMNEESLSLLKSTVLECLSLQERDQQPTTSRRALQPAIGLRTAGWKADGMKSQAIFSVPLNLLIIPAEEAVALNNFPDWKDDFVMNDHDRSAQSHVEDMQIERELPCEDSVATHSSISSPPLEEQGSKTKILPELLPWDELSFQCQSIASSSAEIQVFPAYDQSLETQHYIKHAEDVDHALPDSSTPDDLLPLEKCSTEESTLRSLPQDAVENESQSLFSPSSNYSCRSVTPEASDNICKSPVTMDQTCEPNHGISYVPKSVSFDYVKSTVSLVPYNLPKVDYFEYYLEKQMYSSRKAPLSSSILSSEMKNNALDSSTSDTFGSKKEEDLVPSNNEKRATKRKHLTEDAFSEVEEALGTVSWNRSHKTSSPKSAKGKVLQKPILEFLG
ncbi:adrenocortical dysplasia protein homolog isoform X2 [Microcaecilia unicolor]|uniref:Uncharacterized protein LOC115473512 isoform X2 n=1 Tax=Microcaecilia unicolor TaxID=1415580 RepID=A0A6P7YMM1_9AMPH|nr:uncharacterized protein LOC115473512 isoform X2 [Microcaecilia unicolor]